MSADLSFITDYHARIDEVLSAALESGRTLMPAASFSRTEREAYDALVTMCSRPSKNIRGCLAAAAYDMAAGTRYASPGLQLGAVMELMQVYLLIIDDVMDCSETRRGGPSTHAAYGRKKTVSPREADMLAVNVGLLAQHLADVILARIKTPVSSLGVVMQAMHANLYRTGLGQIRDLTQRLGSPMALHSIIRTYEQKSSYYTFVSPLECGLLLAGKDQVMADCRAFGLPAGVAFQLRNDLDGLESGEATVGLFADLREGRATWLLHYAFQQGSLSQRAYLRSCMGRRQLSSTDIAQLREVLDATGAVRTLHKTLRSYSSAAQKAAQKATAWDGQFAMQLCALVSLP